MTRIIVYTIVALTFVSCQRIGHHKEQAPMLLPLPKAAEPACVWSIGDAEIDCGVVSLRRISAKPREVVMPTQEFEDQFRGVYYNDFFEQLMVEPDLRRLFAKDAVILGIQSADRAAGPMLKSCKTCNAVATILWKDVAHKYPYTAAGTVLEVIDDKDRMVGHLGDLEFAVYRGMRRGSTHVSLVSKGGEVLSYQVTKGSIDDLLAVLWRLADAEG